MPLFCGSRPLLGCALFPATFIAGFSLAKHISMRRGRSGRKAGCMCILAVLQTILWTVGVPYLWIGIFFSVMGYRSVVPGITGGLASGKSTATSFLKDHGWDVIDADEIAKRVLQKGTLAYYQAVRAFGDSIVDETTGEISRPRLRQLVFQNTTQRRVLNGITHPWIIANIVWQLFKLRICLWRPRVILDIPLLFETHLDVLCGPTTVIYVTEELQLRRLIARDHSCSEHILRSMIRCQLPLQEKASLSDIVLDNCSTRDRLFEQIKQHFPC